MRQTSTKEEFLCFLIYTQRWSWAQPSSAAPELYGDQKPGPGSEAGDCPWRTTTPSGHVHRCVLVSLGLPRAQVPLIEENLFLLQAASSHRTQTIRECELFAVARLREDPPGTFQAAKPQWGRRCPGCFKDSESEESTDHFWLQQEVSASRCGRSSLHGRRAPACGSVCPSRPPWAVLCLGWRVPPRTLVHTRTGTLAVLWDCFRGKAGVACPQCPKLWAVVTAVWIRVSSICLRSALMVSRASQNQLRESLCGRTTWMSGCGHAVQRLPLPWRCERRAGGSCG